MGIVTTEILPLKDFLQNKHLHIPHFQRPYKWSIKNVIQLLDDIQRFKGTTPYRIGTIVIHKEGETYNIVDGQQRTVTFLLILKAVLVHKYDELKSETLKELLSTIKAHAFIPTFKNEVSKKNIQDNYREIERRIAGMEEDFIHFFLNQCEITHFVIDDISEAFQFFDSQNARGKDLEPHDLLKAFHLRELNNGSEKLCEQEIARLVDRWEAMETSELSDLFANFLYRVRGWSKGISSRFFTKKDTPLFKGINLSRIENYPYTQIYKMLDSHINGKNGTAPHYAYPFQLDQIIINGKIFFEMIAHYEKVYRRIRSNFDNLTNEAQTIWYTINQYEGKNRTGDRYVRMLFDCALLYYIDKFGELELSKAIQKIFIWAYTPRLTYQSLQLASIDNYVVEEQNLFKKIKEAIHKEEIITIELPLIQEDYENEKTAAIKDLFQKMKYYAN